MLCKIRDCVIRCFKVVDCEEGYAEEVVIAFCY